MMKVSFQRPAAGDEMMHVGDLQERIDALLISDDLIAIFNSPMFLSEHVVCEDGVTWRGKEMDSITADLGMGRRDMTPTMRATPRNAHTKFKG